MGSVFKSNIKRKFVPHVCDELLYWHTTPLQTLINVRPEEVIPLKIKVRMLRLANEILYSFSGQVS